ncbi:hypothetical protein C358_04211 [Cryptococcus neoformans MW-RSA852]|nr:hypothetical protein C358_04211 [Cryptococcus neoformans var. grubii MW-RSA852]
MTDCVVRGCTIHRNGQANNHDVAAWLAQAGTYAHLITVGLFATETGIWEASNKMLVILYICFLVLSLLFSGYPIPSDPKYSMMLNTGGMIGTSSTQSGSGDVGHVIKKWCPNCGTKGDGNDPPCIATIMYAASIRCINLSTILSSSPSSLWRMMSRKASWSFMPSERLSRRIRRIKSNRCGRAFVGRMVAR